MPSKDRQSPKLKKNGMITLPFLVAEMQAIYNLNQHLEAFGDAYLEFEATRITNDDLPVERQDPTFTAYTDAARSDSLVSMTFRHTTLHRWTVSKIPELTVLDETRGFTDEQRFAIYWRDEGMCQWPECDVHCDESDFHADHIVPHSYGGRTTVQNGQVLCPPHNLQKGNGPMPE